MRSKLFLRLACSLILVLILSSICFAKKDPVKKLHAFELGTSILNSANRIMSEQKPDFEIFNDRYGVYNAVWIKNGKTIILGVSDKNKNYLPARLVTTDSNLKFAGNIHVGSDRAAVSSKE